MVFLTQKHAKVRIWQDQRHRSRVHGRLTSSSITLAGLAAEPENRVTLDSRQAGQSVSVAFRDADIRVLFEPEIGLVRIPCELMQPVYEAGSPDARDMDGPCDLVNGKMRFA